MTHYIPAFTEINGRDQKAACGAWIRAHEHSNEPTCDACHAYVESEAAAHALTAEDVFGVPSDAPVKPSYGARADAQIAGYRERHVKE